MRRLLLVTGSLLFALALDQLLLFTALSDGQFRGRAVAPFDPPLFNEAQRESLERIRALSEGKLDALPGNVQLDAELGWTTLPDTVRGECAYDSHGSRVVRGAPERGGRNDGVRRVVAIGGSFTHGDEVKGHETWPHLADEQLAQVEVHNLGVGAYGIDQAVLRLGRDGRPLEPDEVWLGLMPSAALRVLTLYRPALRHHDLSVSFKPRFRLGPDGELQLIQNPARSAGELVRLLSDQAAFLDALADGDHWVNRLRSAFLPRGSHWSHHLALGRLALTRMEGGGRDVAAALADPEGDLFRLMKAILCRLHADCERDGVRLRIVLLPDRDGLRSLAAGQPYWEALLHAVEAEGVSLIDTSPALLAAHALEDGLFWRPGGHYSIRANRVVARAVAEAVR